MISCCNILRFFTVCSNHKVVEIRYYVSKYYKKKKLIKKFTHGISFLFSIIKYHEDFQYVQFPFFLERKGDMKQNKSKIILGRYLGRLTQYYLYAFLYAYENK